jgi:monoamine oxidase
MSSAEKDGSSDQQQQDDDDNYDNDVDISSSKENIVTTTTTTTKVIIIGAGFSGLSVAYHLMKMIDEGRDDKENRIGIDIEIIEGRNRIGGRVHSYNFLSSNNSTGGDNSNSNGNGNEAPCWIDLGGQWLHGASDENPIRRLMEDDLDLAFIDKNNDENKSKKICKSNTNTTTNRFYKKRYTNVLFDKYGNKMNNSVVQRAKNIFYKSINDLEVDDEDNDNFDDMNYDTKTSYQDLINNRLQPLYNKGRQRQRRNRQQSSRNSRQDDNDDNDNNNDDNDNDDNSINFNSAMNYFIHRSEENEGGQLQLVSAKLANNLYYGFHGPDLIPTGSYKSVLDGIITKLNLVGHDSTEVYNDSLRDRRKSKSSSCRIRLRMNTKVSRIEYDNDNDNDDSEVSITVEKNISSTNNTTSIAAAAAAAAVGPEEEEEEELEEEEILKADYCVCTVPLGVLKSGDIKFIPPLSKEKQEAIHGIGFGILNKIVYKFPVSTNGTKFWGNDIKQFGYCHDDISLVKTYYDCTDDYIINDATTAPHKESSKEAILIQFLAGKAADRIDPPPGGGSGIGISDEEIIKESMHTLRLIFGDDIHNVPEPICEPIVTRWNNDQYSYGSYSYTKINSSAKMYTDIAAPATPSLFFAGEHTSKHYHSTVHGAWSTGKREAERIMEHISNKSNRKE